MLKMMNLVTLINFLAWINYDIPDADLEDHLACPDLVPYPSRKASVYSAITSSLYRRGALSRPSSPNRDCFDNNLNSSVDTLPRIGGLKTTSHFRSPTRTSNYLQVRSTIAPEIVIESPECENIKLDEDEFDLADIRHRSLDRLKTLPTNPQFRSPAFRSVPICISSYGIRGTHVAIFTICLALIMVCVNIAFTIIGIWM